jgi:hypothetical protein
VVKVAGTNSPQQHVSPEANSDNVVAEAAGTNNPQQIDQAIQQQGKELHELLRLFRQANTEPLATYILQTPTNITKRSRRT